MEKILYSSVFCVPQKKKVIQVWIDVRVSKWWQFSFLKKLSLTQFHKKKLWLYRPILITKYVAFASVFLKTMWMVLGEQSSSETNQKLVIVFWHLQVLQVAQQQHQQQQQQPSGEKSPKSSGKEADAPVEPYPPPPTAHAYTSREPCCLHYYTNRLVYAAFNRS